MSVLMTCHTLRTVRAGKNKHAQTKPCEVIPLCPQGKTKLLPFAASGTHEHDQSRKILQNAPGPLQNTEQYVFYGIISYQSENDMPGSTCTPFSNSDRLSP